MVDCDYPKILRAHALAVSDYRFLLISLKYVHGYLPRKKHNLRHIQYHIRFLFAIFEVVTLLTPLKIIC